MLWLKETETKLDKQNSELMNQWKNQRKHLPEINTEEKKQIVRVQQNKLAELLNAGTYDKRFLEIFNAYLDKENRAYTRFAIK
jgi:hypothetical protein